MTFRNREKRIKIKQSWNCQHLSFDFEQQKEVFFHQVVTCVLMVSTPLFKKGHSPFNVGQHRAILLLILRRLSIPCSNSGLQASKKSTAFWLGPTSEALEARSLTAAIINRCYKKWKKKINGLSLSFEKLRQLGSKHTICHQII